MAEWANKWGVIPDNINVYQACLTEMVHYRVREGCWVMGIQFICVLLFYIIENLYELLLNFCLSATIVSTSPSSSPGHPVMVTWEAGSDTR